MGAHRLFLWSAILVPVVAVADWSQTDSGFLQLISGNVSALKANSDAEAPYFASMSSDLASSALSLQSVDDCLADIALSVDDIPGIAGDVEDIASDVHYIRQYTHSIDTSVTTVSLNLQAIFDAVDAILSDVDKFQFANQSSQVEQYNHRSVYVHDVRTDDIDYKLGLFGASLTNQLNVLNASVNNLTNFIGSSMPAVYTNLAALSLAPAAFLDYDFESLRWWYSYVTGVSDASDDAVLSFWNTWSDIGPLQSFYIDKLSHLANPSSIGILDTDISNTYDELFTYFLLDSYPPASNIGDLHYAEYGTYGILQAVHSISNSLFEVSDGDFLIRSSSSSSSGSSWSLGATASSALSGIKESASFTGVVGTNIVGSVLSGPINPIADNDYNSSLTSIKESTPSSFTDLDGVLSEINGVKGTADDIVSLLDNADHNNDFVISGDIAMPHIGSQTLSITISNQTARMGPIVNFFCVCMEFFMLIYFVSVAWDDVVQVVFGRRLM